MIIIKKVLIRNIILSIELEPLYRWYSLGILSFNSFFPLFLFFSTINTDKILILDLAMDIDNATYNWLCKNTGKMKKPRSMPVATKQHIHKSLTWVLGKARPASSHTSTLRVTYTRDIWRVTYTRGTWRVTCLLTHLPSLILQHELVAPMIFQTLSNISKHQIFANQREYDENLLQQKTWMT